jgi:hypothetical protein
VDFLPLPLIFFKDIYITIIYEATFMPFYLILSN